jgi:hypothetical protein
MSLQEVYSEILNEQWKNPNKRKALLRVIKKRYIRKYKVRNVDVSIVEVKLERSIYGQEWQVNMVYKMSDKDYIHIGGPISYWKRCINSEIYEYFGLVVNFTRIE